jgi:hypothetical protein
MASITADRKKGEWASRHNVAVYQIAKNGETVSPMLRAWAQYAKEHREQYESPIGEDYVLGPEWRTIGLAIRALLNGNCGRLDCGTLDAFILDSLQENGFDVAAL